MDRSNGGPRAGKIVFWALSPLWLLLILALALFAVLTSAGFPVYDQAALAQEAPMPASERYAISAAERRVEIAVDPSDVAYIIENGDLLDIDEVMRMLSDYALTLSGYGLHFAPEGPLVNVKLTAFGFVPVPVQLALDVAAREGGEIALSLESAKLTKFYTMTADEIVDRFGLKKSDLAFTLDGADLSARLATLENISFQNDRMRLGCKIDTGLFTDVLRDPSYAAKIASFVSDSPALTAFVRSGGTGAVRKFDESFDNMLKQLEEAPALWENTVIDCLAMANTDSLGQMFSGTAGLVMQRFLPDVTQQAVAARREAFTLRVADSEELLAAMVQNLDTLYTEGNLLYAGTHFVRKGAEDTPVTVENLVDDFGPYEGILKPEETRIVLCSGGIENLCFGFNKKLSQMPRIKGVKYQNLYASEVHMPVIMTKLAGGQAAFIYFYEINGEATLSVDTFKPHIYDALMAAEYIPAAYFGPDGDNT